MIGGWCSRDFMNNTPDERIAELNHALERHRKVLAMLNSAIEEIEGILSRALNSLQTLRADRQTVQAQIAEAQASVEKLSERPVCALVADWDHCNKNETA